MRSEIPSPVIIAHRGASILAPENTLAAFDLAIKQGAMAVEFDVKLSADRQVIVIHDQTVDRTTDGHGDVRTLSLSALQELDAGRLFQNSYRNVRIPTLEQVFESFGRQLFMNIELTNYATPFDDLVPRVVALVKKFNLEKWILFSSFYPRNLNTALSLLADVPRGLLTFAGWMGWWGRKISYYKSAYYALHPNIKDVDAGLIARAHASGKRVNIWTVNEPDDIKRLIGWGADGIITDDPALANRVLLNRCNDSA